MSTLQKHLFGLRENLAILFRYRRKIIQICLVTVVVTLISSIFQSKVYESSARLLIQQNRTSVPVGATFSAPWQTNPFGQKDRIRTEAQIFLSGSVIDSTVEQLGAEEILEQMRWKWDWFRELPGNISKNIKAILKENIPAKILPLLGLDGEDKELSAARKAAKVIYKHLTVNPVREADALEVVFEAPDSEFTALMVNELIDQYLMYRVAIRKGGAASEVFAEEAQRLHSELQDAQSRLQAFKTEFSIVSIEAQKQLQLSRISNADAQLQDADIEMLDIKERITKIQLQLKFLPKDIPLRSTSHRNPALDALQNQLAQLEVEKSQYVEGSSAARAVESQIAVVRKRMRSEKSEVGGSQITGINKAHQDLQESLLVAQRRLVGLASMSILRDKIKKYRLNLTELTSKESQLEDLKREVNLKAEVLLVFQKKQAEAQLGQLLDQKRVSNVVALEKAKAPDRHVRPRKLFNLMIGLIAGLMAGLGYAYLRDYFRRTLVTREEAEDAFNLPVIASFLDEGRSQQGSKCNAAEAKRLGEMLLRQRQDQGTKTFLIASHASGEGKSFVARAMASGLAQHEMRVALVVDQTAKGKKQAKALESICAGTFELPRSVLSSEEDAEYTKKEKDCPLKKHLAALLARYDYVIIDGVNPEGLILSACVDATLFVVEAECTPAVSAQRSLRAITEAGGNIGGVILNGRRHEIPDWVYTWLLNTDRHSMVQKGRA